MAKKNKNKKSRYVMLGEKASSFYDAVSKVKLVPGQVVKLTPKQMDGKLTADALRGGHLEYSTEEEYDEYQEFIEKQTKKFADLKAKKETQNISITEDNNSEEDSDEQDSDDEEEDDEDDNITLEDMPSKKDEILKWLIENSVELEMDKTEEELNSLNKSDLVDYAQGLFSEKGE